MFMFFEHCVFVRLNDSSSFFEVVLIGLYAFSFGYIFKL
jgi:hypothetical protein